MRTKTLLLAAVLSAAGAAASFAQAVYSVNAVGYVNLTFARAGFYIVTNPLNNGNNQLSTVMPAPPDGTTVFRFNNGQFGDPPGFVAGAGWFNSTGPATDVLAPGEGFFLQLPSTATFPVTVTFIGEVPQGQTLANPVTIGGAGAFSLIASQVPVSAALLSTNIMQFPAADGDTVYFFDGATQAYKDSFNYVAGAGWFNSSGPTNPTPAVGEGFFLLSGAATSRTWTRSFSVNTP